MIDKGLKRKRKITIHSHYRNLEIVVPVTNLLAYTGGSEELENMSLSSYTAFRLRLPEDKWFLISYTAIFLSSPERFWFSTKSGRGDRVNFGKVWNWQQKFYKNYIHKFCILPQKQAFLNRQFEEKNNLLNAKYLILKSSHLPIQYTN